MLHTNTKIKVCALDGDTDYIYTVASVLQRDTLAPFQFIICLDYVLITSIDIKKGNGLNWQRKAEDTPCKQLQTRTTPMT